MPVKQISVFLENKSGRLADVTKILGENGINISALSIADTTDFGILRLIVSDPEKAEKVLREKKFTVSTTEVIALEVSDDPGGLADALEILKEEDISVEYLYAFTGKSQGGAMVLFRVEEPHKAAEKLSKRGIKILNGDFIYNL